MQLSLNLEQLESYCLKLLNFHFPDNYNPRYDLRPILERTLERVEYCFSHIHLKYYYQVNEVKFDHMNSDHFASFLYFFSNTVWQYTKDEELPSRIFYLNKIMHGIDLFYSVKMPDIFLLVHPIGTILGNASYSDYLVVYQNVTVGADEAGIYPTFGKGTVLYSKSSIIGECLVGNDVVLGANTFLLNTNVSDRTLVVGQYPSCKFLSNTVSTVKRIFNEEA